MRKQQLEFSGVKRPKSWFGGALLKGNPRGPRPLDSKLPLHLVLRSQARLSLRSPQHFAKVNQLVYEIAAKYGVRVYEFANVGNHLHLLIKISRRRLWARYIRELTGRIAQEVQGLRGRQAGEKFWAHRPFTRVVKGWKKAYRIARDYVVLNQLEALGFISRKETRNLKELRQIWAHDG